MKIIDNRKDYYDYFVGINGIDTDVVLDRRHFRNVVNIQNKYSYETLELLELIDTPMTLQIGCKIADFQLRLHINGNPVSYKEARSMCRYGINSFKLQQLGKLTLNISDITYRKAVKMLNAPINLKRVYTDEYSGQPCHNNYGPVILSGTVLTSIFTPEEVYSEIYDWVVNSKTISIPEMSDIQKVESHGFDKKKSFRHRK